MKGHLFIVSIPHKRGIFHYDTESMLALVPQGYKVISREPDMSVTADEVLFTWKCDEIADHEPAKYNAGVIGKNTRYNRF